MKSYPTLCYRIKFLKKCLLIMVAYCDILIVPQYEELSKEESAAISYFGENGFFLIFAAVSLTLERKLL